MVCVHDVMVCCVCVCVYGFDGMLCAWNAYDSVLCV